MSERRLARIERLLKVELSGIIQMGLKDPRVGFVTVTGVKVSADLGHAKVFVSVLGDAPVRERTMAGIASAAGYIQRALGAKIRLKFTPRLEFSLDESMDRGFHIEEILKKIDAEKRHE